MQVKKKPKKTAKAVPEKSRKKKQPSEDQIKKQPFLKRMLFGEEKPDLSELEAGSTTILDILSPTTVDTKSRDYIIVDDVYHAYLYITGYGYTTTVGTCWLAPLVEAGEGITLASWRQSKRPIAYIEKERGGARYEGSENEGASNFPTDVPDRCAEYLSYADAALVIF